VGVTCQNDGMCEDEPFTYMCTNCPGYMGQDCDEGKQIYCIKKL